ncbi:Protein of unknown function [Cotesia congregata]|uniref:Uncharacterized protein n=1 Tax=Cotesia congregata TaxID=51543 RepID=A0A8J2HG43_COTCN|nr:Protein of unknown function [Cotesia congregata]
MQYIFIVFTKIICNFFALEILCKFINMAKLEAKIFLALCIISLMSSVVSSCYKAGQWCYDGDSNKCCPNGYNDKIAPDQRQVYRCLHRHYRHGSPSDIITCERSNLRKFRYN